VNLASRLESLADEDSILIAYETYALVKDQIKCAERTETKVKGIAYAVRVFEVLDSYENLGIEPGSEARRNTISERQKGFRLDLDLDQADLAQTRSRLQQVLESLAPPEGPQVKEY